ncbi:nucleoside phosphatase GDA1/CD39 [Aureobasidium pullulans]|uniref:guanosine-diphosphatase n=1 Tax=Aureobasidium pullulans TaxID=5580 RepID=A0AB74JB61_AURPU|nr:nucleoside phosphatase GDA1/CD39 [Aureobasidium pullulans]
MIDAGATSSHIWPENSWNIPTKTPACTAPSSQQKFHMSKKSDDVKQRPSLWSYISFSSSPRRRTSFSSHSRTQSQSIPLASSNYDPFAPTTKSSSMQEKAGWMNQGQRMRYIKTGGIVALVLFVLYYLLPGSTPSVGKFPGGDVASDPSVGTAKCTRSYSANKPLIQYALMVDAGSTGSRIHVYRFNNCGPTPELENEDFKMTATKEGGSGLSSYDSDAEGAAKSLDMLLEVAMKNVPDKLKGCTPIAVKATAGLRKLGPEKSNAILKAVRNRLETVYPFPVVSEANGGVEVMDGKDEGVYAWITTNYLLGKIGGPDKNPTAAVFDLGGGSTQIVFEPTFAQAKDGGMPEQLAEGDHKYKLSFGGRDFTLYQHSYLGYGLMAARENLHKVVIDNMHKANPDSNAWLSKPVLNPCLIPGTTREVKVPLGEGHALGTSVTVNMTGPTTGSAPQCRAIAELTLKKEEKCTISPCAFNGVHQPSLSKTFSREDVYLFSYFYDRAQPLGMPESFTLSELKDLTARVCEGPKSDSKAWDVFKPIDGAIKELQGRPETCLDLNFMVALLHTGYEMPIDREVKIAKKIKGNELGWCLGASQESGWKCKISQVA